MPISLTCPDCGKRLKARDELAGKRLPCPHCGTKVLVAQPEEDGAGYSLQDEPAPASSTSVALSVPAGEEAEPIQVRRKSAPAGPKSRKTEVLPPLTTNEPPLWLRHLHWLLVLALLPLAFSLLNRGEQEDFKERYLKSLEAAPPEAQLRFLQLSQQAENGEQDDEKRLTKDDLLAILPEHKLLDAWLPHDSFAHWGFAAGATVLFMAFFLLLAAQKTAEPHHLLGMGLFTATVGILLLLLLQVIADWTQGIWLRGGNIVVVIFYFVKLIGFSYQAALDPSNGFFLSFLGYTLGVGFCEEVCKALPLLWYYRNPSEQRWRTAFLWGLASGAGFGISEGITYASRYYNGISSADIYVVRFISCVALHALWTGSVAITLQQKQGLLQGVESWYEYIPRLYLIVGVPMVLHGLYDTLLKKDLNAGALVVAVLSFLFLAFQISRLHGEDDEEAKRVLLREYKRRRAAMS
ncbi:MAG TPA: PrsW family glutamic-type intramembrane protease [Gemmataceae bacterium]|nr:PrsW family glutamic-type intramembrane protease [Gemmataceae bacterium]